MSSQRILHEMVGGDCERLPSNTWTPHTPYGTDLPLSQWLPGSA